MDDLPDMDFEGGIDSLDLSSVGNAEEVGSLLSPMCHRLPYEAGEREQSQLTIPYAVHETNGSNINSYNEASTFSLPESDIPSDPSASAVKSFKSSEALTLENIPESDLTADFDVDCFLNTSGKASVNVHDIHAKKVSTVIHYVPATEISCNISSNTCDSLGDELPEICTDDETSVQQSNNADVADTSREKPPDELSSSELRLPSSTKVISINNTALEKQNLMIKDLMGVPSVAENVSAFSVPTSTLTSGRELVLLEVNSWSAKPPKKVPVSASLAKFAYGKNPLKCGATNEPDNSSLSMKLLTELDHDYEKGYIFETNSKNDNGVYSPEKGDLSTETVNSRSLQDRVTSESSNSEIMISQTEQTRVQLSSQNNDNISQSEQTKVEASDTNAEDKNSGKPQITLAEQGTCESVEYNVHIDDTQKIVEGDGNTKWICNICSGTYASKHNLVTHILSHCDIKPHCCLTCGKLFRQLSHLQTHMLTHSNTRPHTCHICNKAFTQSSHLKRHLITHQDMPPLACKFCKRGFGYASELRAHEKRHELARLNSCKDCGASFDTTRKLKHHMRTSHANLRNLTCEICDKVFNYPSQLKDHVQWHSGKRPYACDKCDNRFMKEHHLRAHQVIHTEAKPYVCPTCSRPFNQQGNLERHMLTHSQERPFKCKVCQKTFAQQQVLRAHLVIHSSKKPHSCHVCGKGFTRAINLKTHYFTHDNIRPHTCFCGASFTVKGNLNRHKKKHHGKSGEISMEEQAAFILKSMSDKSKPGNSYCTRVKDAS